MNRRPAALNAQGDPNLSDIYTDNLPEVHDVMRRMRAMVETAIRANRVLIGETYLPNIDELLKWYGGAAHDELQLPMDMLVGFNEQQLGAHSLPPAHRRRRDRDSARQRSRCSSSTTTTTSASMGSLWRWRRTTTQIAKTVATHAADHRAPRR